MGRRKGKAKGQAKKPHRNPNQSCTSSKSQSSSSSMAADNGVLLMLTPHTSAGFHAKNNQFQLIGPRGFVEQVLLPKNQVYVRIDLPGVPKDNLIYTLDNDKKLVLVVGEEPRESEHEDNGRSYCAAFGLACKCCEISDLNADFRDGVLRMLFKKVLSKDPPSSHCEVTGVQAAAVVFKDSPSATPEGSSVKAAEENPFVLKGSKKAYTTKEIEDGGLFVRVDMPGVAKEDSRVFVVNGEVRFLGRAQTVLEQDTGAREYLGAVSPFPPTTRIKAKGLEHEFKHGVLRMRVPEPV